MQATINCWLYLSEIVLYNHIVNHPSLYWTLINLWLGVVCSTSNLWPFETLPVVFQFPFWAKYVSLAWHSSSIHNLMLDNENYWLTVHNNNPIHSWMRAHYYSLSFNEPVPLTDLNSTDQQYQQYSDWEARKIQCYKNNIILFFQKGIHKSLFNIVEWLIIEYQELFQIHWCWYLSSDMVM